MITPPTPPPSHLSNGGLRLVHVGDYAFNASAILQVKRKGDKVTVYLVGGGWKTFKGGEAEGVWKWITGAAEEVKPPRRL